MAGHSYRDIVEELVKEGWPRLTPMSVHKDVQAQLEAYKADTVDKVEELRQLEDARLDWLIVQLTPKLLQGDVSAVSAVIRIAERRAKLHGLDKINDKATDKLQAVLDEFVQYGGNHEQVDA